MDAISILSFLGITILLILTPGLDMALITRATIQRGQIGAFSAMLGINCASITWTLFAVIGLVALVNNIPHATTVLLTIGALYMGYVGIKDLQKAGSIRKQNADARGENVVYDSNAQLFKKGFIANATNPKIGLYYATVLPNFIVSGKNQGLYVFLMGLTHNILGFIWFMLFAFILTKGTNILGTKSTKANITLATGVALLAFSAVSLYFIAKSFM